MSEEQKPLTEEQQKQQIIAFQRKCFQDAQKHLAEKGAMPKTVVEKDSRFLAPLCALWKFKTQNGKTYWVITGNLPTDHAEVSAASTPRQAIHYFSLQWQMKAEQLLQSQPSDEQKQFAQLLVNRAHGLYELAENDKLWVNEA